MCLNEPYKNEITGLMNQEVYKPINLCPQTNTQIKRELILYSYINKCYRMADRHTDKKEVDTVFLHKQVLSYGMPNKGS
jgi:hypothetical protein